MNKSPLFGIIVIGVLFLALLINFLKKEYDLNDDEVRSMIYSNNIHKKILKLIDRF